MPSPFSHIDHRAASEVFEGGSSLVQVYLPVGEAQAIYGASATAGWHTLGYQSGGTVGPEIESEQLKDEAGTLIRNKETSNEFVFKNSSMQTPATLLNLFELYLELTAHRYRYVLPTAPETPSAWQVWGIQNGLADKENWTIGTAEGATRERAWTIRGTAIPDQSIPTHVVDEVTGLDDEDLWPSTLNNFKTDSAQWDS